MTIIKSGKERYKQECNRCGCIFTYGKMDIKDVCIAESHGAIWQDTVDTVVCPECLYPQKAEYIWNTDYLD